MSKQSQRYTLLQEELEDFVQANEQKLSGRLFQSVYRLFTHDRDIKYSFLVSKSEYLRGQILCEDISCEDGSVFTLVDLINILFHDFLKNVRILSDHNRIYSELKVRDKRSDTILINGEERHTYKRIHKDIIEIEFTLKRKEALRLEVFLADLAELYPDNPYSVDDVLQIMYCDFIEAYKRGEMKNIVSRIIENL